MMNRWISRAVVLLLTVVMMLGCLPALAEETVYPLTLTDQLGREVVIESEPQTIASAYYISSSVLIALGAEDRVAAIEAKADTRPIYALSAPQMLELPSVGTAKQLDLETCAAVKPDLMIVPKKLKDSIETLEELGITVLVVDPEDQERLEGCIALVGEAVNAQDRAAQLVAAIRDNVAALGETLKDAGAPKVYLAGNSALLSTATAKMYQSSLLANAGGENVAAEIDDTYWAEVSYEQILAWNPEVIVLTGTSDYTVDDVLADSALEGCAAVAAGRVYQLPGDIEGWDSPVPGSFLGSLWLAATLHPEQVSMDQWKAAVTDFYSTFYGFAPELN